MDSRRSQCPGTLSSYQTQPDAILIRHGIHGGYQYVQARRHLVQDNVDNTTAYGTTENLKVDIKVDIKDDENHKIGRRTP